MLNISDLTVKYEDGTILKDINLKVSEGEIAVITGYSGCGKSTLIKVLNGVIPTFENAEVEGSIQYKNENLLQYDISERSRYISTVFQNPKTQYYCTNSTDEMAFAMENRGIPREEILRRIHYYCELFHTSDLINRQIFKLSGGEKQMIAVTSVACMEQDIYLFDEPSSSLDQEAIERLKHAIVELKKMGKIILIAEHRLYYLRDCMDSLHIIQDKEMIHIPKAQMEEGLSQKYHLRGLLEVKNTDLDAEAYMRKDMFSKKFEEDSALRCIDYSYSYRRKEKIFDFNISFDEGINFIVGANGVGKSSFIRSMCGLNKGFKGRTYYKGRLCRNPSKDISLVMQDVNYQLFTESVWDEISIVCDDDSIKESVLRRLGLFEKKDFHPQSLSGGEKQRLLIGLCKASPKPIVVLDEPTSGLCKKNMSTLIELIHEMKKEGKMILTITHDFEFIKECGGNVIEFSK